MNPHMILIVVACILWLIAAIWGFVRQPNQPGYALNLEALGLFFFGLSFLVR